MRVSVVINTCNRAKSLEKTLCSLRYQTYREFEVVVVNGPSTDHTESLLSRWAGAIRVEHCAELVLGRSRNIGLNAASGDIVAFIDDDAVAESDWLETIIASYEYPRVGGAGGLVFDRSGYDLQYRYSACDRLGNTRFDINPPFESYLIPGADPFLYLQGTNCSFRRNALAEIGGFDDEIEFMYDEVEVCLRLTDAGYTLVPLGGAAVHHKHHTSHLRTEAGALIDPYPIVKNRTRFAVRYGTDRYGERGVSQSLNSYVAQLTDSVSSYLARGLVSTKEYDRLILRINQGLEDGMSNATSRARSNFRPQAADPGNFKAFPTVESTTERLRVAFISGEYPPGYYGGIGRYTQDLASGMAEAGHEVHVVTPSSGQHSIELDAGVWVHRVRIQDRSIPEIDNSPIKSNWLHLAAYYNEISVLHERRPLSLVSGPLWNSEPLICLLDPRFPTVTTLMTTLKTVVQIHPSWESSANTQGMLCLERSTLNQSHHLHAISRAILEDVQKQYGPLSASAHVIPLGVRDRLTPAAEPAEPDSDTIRLLFVGRLERRKGSICSWRLCPIC